MSHVDPEILALRALEPGNFPPAEQRHLTGCPQCQDDLARLAGIVTLARSGPAQELQRPPDAVWQRIAAELEAGKTRQAAGRQPERRWPLVPRRPQPDRQPGQSRPAAAARRRVAVVAAAAVLIGAGGAAGVQQLARSQPAVVARVPLRPLAGFPRWHAATGTAVMVRDSSGLVLRVALNASPGHGFFEVWLLGRDGVSMISLGDLNRAHTGTFTLPPGANLTFYSRIDISLQAFNGNTSHSKVSVVRGSLAR